MPKILVIEDEPAIADFVSTGLKHYSFDVAVARTGLSGLETAQRDSPDLVVLDLMLPDVEGIEVCRRLRAGGDMGILILTARHLVGDRVRGLEAGADDYLAKPFAFEELVARIRSVLRRSSGWTEGVVQVGDLVIDLERRHAQRGQRPIDLSSREYDLLKILAQNAGKPLRRETILKEVWGGEYEADNDPVKVYINYLRRKLNGPNDPDLIHTLRGFGYVLKEPR